MKKLKVLAVSPRFAPVNAADSHRLRLLLPHAAAGGWEVEVLTVVAGDVPGTQDDWLVRQLPANVPIHRVPISGSMAALCNSLALRAMLPLRARGDALLATGGFDLVFFSTTEFLTTLLGPYWRHKHGVSFCVDYQDPWVNDYYGRNPAVPRPGGRLKFAVMQWLDRWAERRVVAACSGFLAVSGSYIAELQRRYGSAVAGKPALVSGFPGEPGEFTDGFQASTSATWRYIGRGGDDLAKAASAFFAAWQRADAVGGVVPATLHFEALGTSYADVGRARATIAPLVQDMQLQQRVTEQTGRLPYRVALLKLQQSEALVVFGSDDPAYTASKLYAYLLARRPLLVILHRQSPAVAFLQAVGGAVCVTFDNSTAAPQLAEQIYQQWFAGHQYRQTLPLDRTAFEPYTAAAQARLVGVWFGQVLAGAGSARTRP